MIASMRPNHIVVPQEQKARSLQVPQQALTLLQRRDDTLQLQNSLGTGLSDGLSIHT